MSGFTVFPCDCCDDLLEAPNAKSDKETGMMVCEECHKFLIAAKAQLARPFDKNGAPICLKGIHRRA
jgi:hypothetical protein